MVSIRDAAFITKQTKHKLCLLKELRLPLVHIDV